MNFPQVQDITKRLPVAGIVAFSLCSTASIYHLLAGKATHPSFILWLPAVLVELVTAWVVAQVVEHARTVTRSNISKQDRRFYAGVLASFVLVALPLVAMSVWANVVEFGHWALGTMFPVASIGCAIGAALPQASSRFEQRKASERQERDKARKQRAIEKQAKARARQEAVNAEQAAASERQERDKRLSRLGKARATFVKLEADPGRSQAEIAAELGISRQAVSQHLAKLEREGLIKRNGGGEIEVIR